MDWSEVLADPCLRNLPYKIELDHYGRIVMSPASNRYARQRARLAGLFTQWFTDGTVLTRCSIETPAGVKVPDVAWASADFVRRHGDATPFPEAPELCVEVMSPSNRAAEMAEKVALYLRAGAREVWLVAEDGSYTLHGPEGQRPQSIWPLPLPARLI